MFKKLFIMLMVGGLLLAGSTVWAAGSNDANSCGWTNIKFAEFLGQQFGIQPGNGPEGQRYQALANALSQRGVSYFLTAKPGDKLSCCGAADALYAISGAKEGAGTCDLKINYLIQKGILKLPATGGDPCGTLCNVPDVFTGIEKFSPPREGPPPTDPKHQDPENPSSRI